MPEEKRYSCPVCGESYDLAELEAGKIPFHEDSANGPCSCPGVGKLVCEEEAALVAVTNDACRQRYCDDL